MGQANKRVTIYLKPEYHRALRAKAAASRPLICPRCGGRMKVVAFLTEYAVVDRIIRHLGLTFAAEKPPPSVVFEQAALMAAEENGDYE